MKLPGIAKDESRLIRYIGTYRLLSFLVVFLVLETDVAFGRTDLKTKLLLQNIRSHLVQKTDEIVKQKECESGLILCKTPSSKEAEGEEEKSEEIPPPPKLVRGQHKPAIKVNPKDVIYTLMPKGRKRIFRKAPKFEENDKERKKLFFEDTSNQSDETNESDDESTDRSTKADDRPIKKPLKLLKQDLKTKGKQREDTDVKAPKKEMKKESDVQFKKPVKKEKIKEIPVKTEQKKKVDKKITDSAEEKGIEDKLIFQTEGFIFVVDSSDVDNDLCEKHSQIYLKQLRKYQVWALMMYDASGKFTSGILQGNVNQYGDYDECLAINAVFKNLKHKPKDSSGIKGKYCLATVDVTTESENKNLRSALDRAESFRFIKSTIQDPGHFIPRFSTINWGVCVPSSCLAQDVEKFLKSRLEVFSNATGLHFHIGVDESNCVVRDDLKFKLDTGSIATILFYGIVITVSLYATLLDVKANKTEESSSEEEKIEKELEEAAKDEGILEPVEKDEEKLSASGKAKDIIMAFSVKRNLELLFSDTNKREIECINGIKSIFTIMLYVAHKTIPLGMTPFSNRTFLTKISNQPITILLRASMIYTDSFLLISGVLTSYNLAREISCKKNVSWAKKIFGRYIRLTPALLAVALFYAYIWDRLSSGPTWNLIVQKSAWLCREHMWRNLFYVQNFFPFEDMCAPQTHQLALDMQLSLLAPLFVHLIHVYDKAGVGILQALLIVSSIMRYISASNNELSIVIYHGMPVSQLYKTANLLYGQTLHRASPYIMGVIVGYLIEKFENQFHIPKAFAALGWILSFSFGFYSIVTPVPLASRGYQYDVQEAAQYAALSPVAWSLALSWLIVACHLGYGGFLNDFLCRKILLVFSRISYSVYLTQFLVFFYNVGVKRIPERFTVADSLNVNEFFTVIGVSVVVTLLFDIPMTKIKKIILEKKTAAINSSEDSTYTESPQRPNAQKYDEKKTEIAPPQDLEGITQEQMELVEEEDEYKYEDKEEDEYEYEDKEEEIDAEDDDDYDDDEDVEDEKDSDEKSSEEEAVDDDEMVVEEVLEIRPLKRSTEVKFLDDSEGKK